ncbi:MAG: alpha-N-arabinofuranosidase, partial [Clostridia bacterium]|nr:alpha-N-arabinofuranosidase [Clostridia bacterium]
APIMTENGGKAWKQTIFYPYLYASLYGNGTALRAKTECATYQSGEGWDIPYLCTSVIYNEERGEVVVFAANRSLAEDMELEIALDGLDGYTLRQHVELYSDDLNLTNSKDKEEISPSERPIDPTLPIVLQKHSWNMLVFKR